MSELDDAPLIHYLVNLIGMPDDAAQFSEGLIDIIKLAA